jgi:hypothetical protein
MANNNTVVFYLFHKPTVTYCTTANLWRNEEFSADIAPYVFHNIGPIKGTVTSYIKSGWFITDEEKMAQNEWAAQWQVARSAGSTLTTPQPRPVNDKQDRIQFVLDLEIIEVELTPGNAVYKFGADATRVIAAGGK